MKEISDKALEKILLIQIKPSYSFTEGYALGILLSTLYVCYSPVPHDNLSKWYVFIIPIVQMRKLRLREMKKFTQGLMVPQWQSCVRSHLFLSFWV